MTKKHSFLSILALLVFSFGTTAKAVVIEDFETGSFGSNWTLASGAAGAVSSAGAHDGSFGAIGAISDGGWYYRTDITVSAGDTLSAWFKTVDEGGRFYLGFGADGTGASSFVAALNTDDIRFQNNLGYGYNELNRVAQSYLSNSWYRLEVVFDIGGDVIGNLYGSDGTTLLNSLTADGVTNVTGGIALRSFGGVAYDTIELISGQIPAPTTLALFGLGLVSFSLVRKKKVI
jgi:hypothetical protein